jgi:polar amino acid transport system substrate-binding protein
MNGKILGGVSLPDTTNPELVLSIYGVRPSETISFSTLNAAIAALKAGRIDAIGTVANTAHLFAAHDRSLNAIPLGGYTYSVSMLARKSDGELIGTINTALEQLKADGSLNKLNSKYIIGAVTIKMENEVSVVPPLPGAPLVTVGVSGDFPPFDYVSPEGKPAGYNVALMSEISRRAGLNVEFVTIPFEAKFSALLSNRIDLFFFYDGVLTNDNLQATDVYYSDAQGALLVRKK